MKIDNPYQKVCTFHQTFDERQPTYPAPFSAQAAQHRAGFKMEELVEFLYAATAHEPEAFSQALQGLKTAIDQAEQKVLAKRVPQTDALVEQVDALTDLLYFTYGSFYLLGVDPTPIFDYVHEANMGKLFPDGQAHHDPVTHKILKPDNWEVDYAPEAKIQAELVRQKKAAQQKIADDPQK